MDAEQLRAVQAPLKERHRKDPGAARITLRAEGRVGAGVTCRIETLCRPTAVVVSHGTAPAG
jgi:hypothetical protein